MKILLTDDHAVVRQGLKLILADHFKKAVFGEARNANEAMSRLAKNQWDVMVLDITLPGRSGLEVLRDIKQLRPKLPVLVLSMHPEDQFAVRLLKAGAAGYLTKESAGEEAFPILLFDAEPVASDDLFPPGDTFALKGTRGSGQLGRAMFRRQAQNRGKALFDHTSG